MIFIDKIDKINKNNLIFADDIDQIYRNFLLNCMADLIFADRFDIRVYPSLSTWPVDLVNGFEEFHQLHCQISSMTVT